MHGRVREIIDKSLERIKARHNQYLASAAVAKANLKSPTSQKTLQDHLQKVESDQTHVATPGPNRPSSGYAPATSNMYHPRSSSTSSHAPQPHLMSPSSGYQQTSNESVGQYPYDAYTANAAQYHMSPAQDGQAYVYNAATPSGGYPQQGPPAQMDSSGNWTHFGGIPHDYMQSMEPANALIALHQQGEAQAGQQQQSPQSQQQMAYMPGSIPNLLRGGSMQRPSQHHQWPEDVWAPGDPRSDQ